MNFSNVTTSSWEKLEDIYLDDEALGVQLDDEDQDFRLEARSDDDILDAFQTSNTTSTSNHNFLRDKRDVSELKLFPAGK